MVNEVGIDPGQVLRDVVAASRQERVGRNDQLINAARWADCYPVESIDPSQLRMSGGDRPVHPGGEGTPAMAGFAVAEFGVMVGKSIGGTERLIADSLDLRHRLPLLWDRVCAYQVDGWQAQKIAQETRHLSLAQAKKVDAAIADQVGRLPWAPVLRNLDGKIIEVDAERIAKLAAEYQRQHGVWVSQSCEQGTKTVFARASAAEMLWFDAMVDRIADVLANRDDRRSKNERRAAALGILANPLLALRLLAEDVAPSLFDPIDCPEPVESAEPPTPEIPEPVDIGAGNDDALESPDLVDQEPPARFPRMDDDLALARAAVAAIGRLDPAKLRPDVTLYVHIAAETLQQGLGVARVEDLGPVITSLVADWLTDCQVTVKPVIDLPAELTPVDAYEIPRAMRERMFLRRPTSIFPYSASSGRRMDLDHNQPYRAGVPGQTRESNLGPLSRREHKIITHGGWQRRRISPGAWLFRAPHGRVLLVNETGTHDLGDDHFGRLIWHAAAPAVAGSRS